MDNSENIMWGAVGVCTAVWLLGWVVLDAGTWIHVFIGAAIAMGSLTLAQGMKDARDRR